VNASDNPIPSLEPYREIISNVIEQVRPRMKADGGDIELVAIEGHKVKVKLSGACAGCGAANATLGGVRRMLSLALDGAAVLVQPV
jgi:Fe-S cluster biogenesis protein NfuA